MAFWTHGAADGRRKRLDKFNGFLGKGTLLICVLQPLVIAGNGSGYDRKSMRIAILSFSTFQMQA